MASLLNRILTLLGRTASDAVDDALRQEPSKSSTASGTTEPSGAAGATEVTASKSSPRPNPPRSQHSDNSSPQSSSRSSSRSSSQSSSRSSSQPSSQGATVYDIKALGLPAFSYYPDPDGEADPGEVVWTWVPFEEDPTQGKDRPVLVLARHDGRLVVAQMTSKDHDHDAAQEARWGRLWHDVGTGGWDRRGRPSEVRLDRLLLVEPAAVRREGATMDRSVFDGVVVALRRHHA